MPVGQMGLGTHLMDSAVPIHKKVLELHAQRDKCDETIANVRNLLELLEEERQQLSVALNELIKESTQEVAKSLSRSNSACNLEDLALQAETGLNGLAQALSGIY